MKNEDCVDFVKKDKNIITNFFELLIKLHPILKGVWGIFFVYFQYIYCQDAEKFYNVDKIYFLTDNLFLSLRDSIILCIYLIFILIGIIRLFKKEVYPERFWLIFILNFGCTIALFLLFNNRKGIIQLINVKMIILLIFFILVILVGFLEYKNIALPQITTKKTSDREIIYYINWESRKLLKTLYCYKGKFQGSIKVQQDIISKLTNDVDPRSLNQVKINQLKNIKEKIQKIVSSTVEELDSLNIEMEELDIFLDKKNWKQLIYSYKRMVKDIIINKILSRHKSKCLVAKNILFSIIPITLLILIVSSGSIINNEYYFKNRKYEIFYNKNFDSDSTGTMVDVVILQKNSYIITMQGNIYNDRLNIYSDSYELKDAKLEHYVLRSFSQVRCKYKTMYTRYKL